MHSDPSGPLMMIGGAEDKLGARTVLSRFVRLAGGAQARIVVVATASSLGDDATNLYLEVFRKLGAMEVVGSRPMSRADAADDRFVGPLRLATGIFMTGGNQMKLSGVVAGTPFGAEILAAHRRGAVVAGTSAGASAQSEHMVAFGAEGATPKLRMVQMSAGLGLIQGVVVDQHFEQRNRYGRLLALVAHSPHLIGLGVDEDTAAVVTGERRLEVIGRGAVWVVDGSQARSNVDTARRTDPLLVSGVVVHTLPAGSCFDLVDRALLPGRRGLADDVRDPAPRDAARQAAASASARRLAKLVAVEGVDDARVESNARRRARRGGTPDG